jgi:hypothetical protein
MRNVKKSAAIWKTSNCCRNICANSPNKKEEKR